MANWESLIGAKIEAHRDTHTVCKIEDAGKRNSRRAQLKWKHEHRAEENERRRKWEAKNQDKIKEYQERAKPAIKKWAEEHRDRVRELGRNFKKFAGEFCKSVSTACGLVAYIPQTFGKVSDHAKALHQCLTYADYTGKMAKRDCLLVFISDVAGHSVATAEIAPNGNIVQFYADEHDRENMKPTPEAESAVNEWIKKFKPKFRTRKIREAA